MKYISLFLLIQLANLPLMVLGWVLWLGPFIGIGVPWLWRNDDDQAIILSMTPWARYTYNAWRNPVANLRHVKGVSDVGRPLWWKTWTIRGKPYYVKAGWMSDGYPALSAGSGKW